MLGRNAVMGAPRKRRDSCIRSNSGGSQDRNEPHYTAAMTGVWPQQDERSRDDIEQAGLPNVGSGPVLGVGALYGAQPCGNGAHGKELKADPDHVSERVVVRRTQGIRCGEEGPQSGGQDENRGGET